MEQLILSLLAGIAQLYLALLVPLWFFFLLVLFSSLMYEDFHLSHVYPRLRDRVVAVLIVAIPAITLTLLAAEKAGRNFLYGG